MGLLTHPRRPIGGTSLFAVTFLGLSTGYAYLHPEGLDRLFGEGTGQPACSVSSGSGALPCDAEAPPLAESCGPLMADEDTKACLVPPAEQGLDDPTASPGAAPLDCCQGGISRGTLLRAPASSTSTDDPGSPVLVSPDPGAASGDQDEAPGDLPNVQE
ncbi:hypothetical protein AB1L88_21675 [Tautonia sp. JC769]|uniref:hypothetical protein n=1 Tax=Tautonia sp. JC769 TaxID=3232135 RepID=UPI00345A4A5E